MQAKLQETAVKSVMQEIGRKAKSATFTLATAPEKQRNDALHAAASFIRKQSPEIIEANKRDMEAARAKGLDDAMLDRLSLNEKRINAIADGIDAIADLDNPVGKVLASWDRPNGLHISRVTVPLGVIGIIYESRPNVTADAGALCLKSGNAAILRGGSESFHSSQAIVRCLHDGLKKADLPVDAIQLVPTTDREAVGVMLTMTNYIDVIVPRGGKGLCQRVMEDSRIPTILHLEGNCHTYIHSAADIDKAVKIVHNAKLRRTGICGATESLVVDESVVKTILPKIANILAQSDCEMRGDTHAREADNRIIPAKDEDWDTEYLDKIISIKTVKGLDDAIRFINEHSSHHTDAIITEDQTAADTFQQRIDSAIVMHNTSTQFADGGEFGMGAEIGISTGRLHARGPVGVEQLVTFKYVVTSDGATRPQ